jgi:hypothetical protein
MREVVSWPWPPKEKSRREIALGQLTTLMLLQGNGTARGMERGHKKQIARSSFAASRRITTLKKILHASRRFSKCEIHYFNHDCVNDIS